MHFITYYAMPILNDDCPHCGNDTVLEMHKIDCPEVKDISKKKPYKRGEYENYDFVGVVCRGEKESGELLAKYLSDGYSIVFTGNVPLGVYVYLARDIGYGINGPNW